MDVSGVPTVLPHADTEHLDEIRLPPQDLEDAILEQGGHPLARGRLPDGGHRFAGDDHLFDVVRGRQQLEDPHHAAIAGAVTGRTALGAVKRQFLVIGDVQQGEGPLAMVIVSIPRWGCQGNPFR